MIRMIQFAAALVVAMIASPAVAQTVEYMHTDALGSVVAITNSSGAVVERNQFEPYGEDLTGIKDGPGYTGHVSDAATGLSYMQQRYYDPQVGRFLSSDPVTAQDDPVRNFNRYRYANNNPYTFKDPDGQDGEFAYGAGVGMSPWITDEQKAVIARAEASARQQSAVSGIGLGAAIKKFVETGDVSKEAVAKAAVTVAIAGVARRATPATKIEIAAGATRASAPQIRVSMSAQDAIKNLESNGFTWTPSKTTPGAGQATKGDVTYLFAPASKSTGLPSATVLKGNKRTAKLRFDE